jgi:hypothetical protein
MNRQSPPPKRQAPTTQTKTQPPTEAQRRAAQQRKSEALEALGRACGRAINCGATIKEIHVALAGLIEPPKPKPKTPIGRNLENQLIGRFFIR